jgi:hypothetical protein
MAREAKFLKMGADAESAGDAAAQAKDYEKAKAKYLEAERFYGQAGDTGKQGNVGNKARQVATGGGQRVLEKKVKAGSADAHFGTLKKWAGG